MRIETTSPVILLTTVAPRKREGSSPTGLVGRHLTRQLLDRGFAVRVLAEPEQTEGWPLDADVVHGSVTRPDESAAAFDRVSRIFLAGAEPASIQQVLRLATRAGVEHIVVLSSHGPEFEQHYPAETWYWLAIEKAVENSAIGWTHIRPSAVMGAVLEGTYPATGSDWPQTIRGERRVREALLGSGYYPFIHESDLAAVAAEALLRSDLAGTILEAVGLPLNTASRVAAIERAIGEKIEKDDCSVEVGRAIWRANGWPQGAIDVTLYGLETYGSQLREQIEWISRQHPSVEALIGRKPISFEQWALDHAHIYASR